MAILSDKGAKFSTDCAISCNYKINSINSISMVWCIHCLHYIPHIINCAFSRLWPFHLFQFFFISKILLFIFPVINILPMFQGAIFLHTFFIELTVTAPEILRTPAPFKECSYSGSLFILAAIPWLTWEGISVVVFSCLLHHCANAVFVCCF